MPALRSLPSVIVLRPTPLSRHHWYDAWSPVTARRNLPALYASSLLLKYLDVWRDFTATFVPADFTPVGSEFTGAVQSADLIPAMAARAASFFLRTLSSLVIFSVIESTCSAVSCSAGTSDESSSSAGTCVSASKPSRTCASVAAISSGVAFGFARSASSNARISSIVIGRDLVNSF